MSAMPAKTADIETAFKVKVWGARGSLPSPGPDTVEFGGHTPCVEVRIGSRLIIFDAGSGITPLGKELQTEGITEIDLFFSHSHYDHIMGLPFFKPCYNPNVKLRIWAGHMQDGTTTGDMVNGFFRAPYFPVTSKCLSACTSYHMFNPWDILEPIEGVRIKTAPLNHTNGAVGYRLTYKNASFAYITDFEHDNGAGDKAVIKLASQADLALLDTTYTPEEYENFKGFGHTHWVKAGELCEEAQVKKWGLFHHLHTRTDSNLRAIELLVRKVHQNAFVTRELQTFYLPFKDKGNK